MNDYEDAAVSEYYSFHPTQFHNLIRFELKQENDAGLESMVLEVDLAGKDVNSTRFLRLKFSGVRELKYIPGYWSFAFIDIVALKAQWEEGQYQVFETEQDTDFSLFCREFKAELLSG